MGYLQGIIQETDRVYSAQGPHTRLGRNSENPHVFAAMILAAAIGKPLADLTRALQKLGMGTDEMDQGPGDRRGALERLAVELPAAIEHLASAVETHD